MVTLELIWAEFGDGDRELLRETRQTAAYAFVAHVAADICIALFAQA